MLDDLDGACSVPAPDLTSTPRPGPQRSGTFSPPPAAGRSATRSPTRPGTGPGARLPLVMMLHGYGGNHADALSGMSPAQALALRVAGAPLPPMALVTVDGGGGYWNPHPGDDPMAMLTDELIPMCRRLGLGARPRRGSASWASRWAATAPCCWPRSARTWSRAVAAISPAIWTSYAQARAANAGAYASAADFAADDAVTHAAALAGVPVRVAVRLRPTRSTPASRPSPARCPRTPAARVTFANGCHDGPFFTAQEPPSLAFLARRSRSAVAGLGATDA